jgi:ATP-dependent RNA helicase DeaD
MTEDISSADLDDEPTLSRSSLPLATPADELVGSARSFDDLGLVPEIARALAEMGYAEPMAVQLAVYDHVLAERDVMVQSRTGTGKTAAFGIPIAQMLSADDRGVRALILAPTRELALQVATELGKIVRHKDLAVVPVYGGAPMKKQIDALAAGAQIVVGTPGRVLDHIRRRTLVPDRARFLVLDECDEMLSMGFLEDIEKIIAALPAKEERQTLLFSATIPDEIQRISKRHLVDPETISLSAGNISVDEIDHYYYLVSGMARPRDLVKVLEVEQPESALIFCNTREDTSNVAQYLQKRGYDASAISSDLSQSDRERVMARTRAKQLRFLVATDVAARGIDISDISHVINYTFPESPEVYVHRTGRTGRAGKSGVAISLVGPREIGAFYYLKLIYKIRPHERELPSSTELATLREADRYREVLTAVAEEPSDEFRALARRLWAGNEGERVTGALLQRLLAAAESTPAQPVESAAPRPAQSAAPRPAQSAAPRPAQSAAPRPAQSAEPTPRSDRERSRRDTAGPAASTRADDNGGDESRPRRRRRRRTETAGRRDRTTAPTPARTDAAGSAEPTEFWEAWADEKTIRDSRSVLPAASHDAAPESTRAPDAPSPAGAEDETDEAGLGMVRLYVNIGRRERATPEEIRALLAERLGTDVDRLGQVHVRSTHTYIRVPEDLVERVIESAQGQSYKNRALVVERARR